VKYIPFSIFPPVNKNPSETILNGQKGIIPFLVKLSQSKCKEYPKKNPNASIGKKTASITLTIRQKVKLCKIPLCLVKKPRIGVTGFFLPNFENLVSKSGIIVATTTAKIKKALLFTTGKNKIIENKAIAKWVLSNISPQVRN